MSRSTVNGTRSAFRMREKSAAAMPVRRWAAPTDRRSRSTALMVAAASIAPNCSASAFWCFRYIIIFAWGTQGFRIKGALMQDLKKTATPSFLAFGFSALALVLTTPAVAQPARDCNNRLCESVVAEPISLYGGQAAGLAIWGKMLFVAENVNNNWGSAVPQGPFVQAVSEGHSTRITPPGLLGDVTALAFDSDGNLYIADGNGTAVGQPPCRNVVWKIARGVGTVTVFASVNNPTGLAFDSVGNLYVASFGDGAVYKYSPTGQFLGSPLGNLTRKTLPYGIAIDADDNLYVAAYGTGAGGAILKVTPSSVTVFANLAPDHDGVSSLVFDQYGNLYASYYNGLKILRVAPDGSYVIFPGGGVADDAANGLAYDGHGNLYVSVNGGRTTTYPAVVALRGLVPTQ